MNTQIQQLKNNGVRIHVTSHCNLDCVFCHNKGQNYRKDSQKKSSIINNNIIAKFISDGVRSFTFTGGEPLVCYNDLRESLQILIDRLSTDILKELDITIVTNGILFNNDNISFFRNFADKVGKFKFNISLHTYDAGIYKALTQRGDNFEKVLSNLELIRKFKLQFKINYVLLKTKNSKEDILERMFEFSVKNNIADIKIIEMLVTEFNRNFYHEFHEIAPLLYNLRHRAKTQIIDGRKAIYHLKDLPLKIEIIRCTCSLGCNECHINREIEISRNTYKPCFLSDEKIPFDENTNIESVYKDILKRISYIASKYGDSSPSLIVKQKLIPERNIFRLNISNEQFEMVWKNGIKTYQELIITDYFHPFEKQINNPYTFYLETLSESPDHTKIVCSAISTNNYKDITFLKEEFLDKVYHFAMSKKQVCEKKLKAMSYIPGNTSNLKFEIIHLSKYENDKNEFILLKRLFLNDKVIFLLEITATSLFDRLEKILQDYSFTLINYDCWEYPNIRSFPIVK